MGRGGTAAPPEAGRCATTPVTAPRWPPGSAAASRHARSRPPATSPTAARSPNRAAGRGYGAIGVSGIGSRPRGIGLVGCGWVGSMQLAAYQAAGYAVVGLTDHNPARAQALRETYFPDAAVHPDVASLLADDT